MPDPEIEAGLRQIVGIIASLIEDLGEDAAREILVGYFGSLDQSDPANRLSFTLVCQAFGVSHLDA